jgi:hypothetical protein
VAAILIYPVYTTIYAALTVSYCHQAENYCVAAILIYPVYTTISQNRSCMFLGPLPFLLAAVVLKIF